MTTDPPPRSREPDPGEETLPDLLAEVLDLADEAVAQISDAEVETRLQRVLEAGGGEPPQAPPDESAPAASPEQGDAGRTAQAEVPELDGRDRAAFRSDQPSLMLLSVARWQASAIIASAQREAEEHRDAASAEAEQILSRARKEAERLLSPAVANAGPSATMSGPSRAVLAFTLVSVVVAIVVLDLIGISGTTIANAALPALAVALVAAFLGWGLKREQLHVVRDVRALLRTKSDQRCELDAAALDRLLQPGGAEARRGAEPAPHTFWASLTPGERQAFTRVAQPQSYAAGDILCRQGELGDHIIVLRSGWVKVLVDRENGQEVLALRGPGELIGERAALTVQARSATVVAVSTVEALVSPTPDFADFLAAHPRILGILERQIYERLTEGDRRPAHEESAEASPVWWNGENYSIMLADILDFGTHDRGDDDRMRLRRVIYELLRDSFDRADIPWSHCHLEDRGDGVLIVIPLTVPTSSVADPLVAYLSSGLRRHNRRASEGVRFQLRVALHIGPVVSDQDGVSGQAVTEVLRLSDSPAFEQQLRTSNADLGFIASSFVYDMVIRHNRGYTDADDYQRLEPAAKDSNMVAWMHLFGAARSSTDPSGALSARRAIPGLST